MIIQHKPYIYIFTHTHITIYIYIFVFASFVWFIHQHPYNRSISLFPISAPQRRTTLTHSLAMKSRKRLARYVKMCTGATPAGLFHVTDTDFQTQREGLKVKVRRSINVYSLFSLKSPISMFLHQHNDVNKFPTNRRNLCAEPPTPPPFFFYVGFVCVCVCVCVCV